MKVLAIERKAVAGGGLATLEDPRHPGFLHNTHAFFQRAITTMPWYADLELERHGAHYIEPELNVALLTERRRRARMVDRHRAHRAVVRAVQPRATPTTLRRWQHEFVPIVQRHPGAREPSRRRCRPTSGAACSNAAPPAAACWRSARCRRSNSCSRSSSIRPCRRACCSSTACARSICACAASAITSRRCSRAPPRRRCRAAAPRRSRARSRPRCARAAARFRLMTEPKRIVVEDGRAVGVETADGELIRARHFVASSLNPHQTFLDLLDEALVPREIRDRVERLPIQSAGAAVRAASQSARAAALYGERQASRAGAGLHGDHGPRSCRSVPRHRAPSRGRHDPADRDVGRLSDAVRSEPGAARPAHRLHVGEAALPPARRCGELGRRGDAHGRDDAGAVAASTRPISRMPSSIRSRARRSTPSDRLPNMREGDLLVGAFTNGQIGYHRPFRGAGAYRTHIPGSICADRAAIPAATSPACPATMRPKSSWPTSASARIGPQDPSRRALQRSRTNTKSSPKGREAR